MTNGIKEVDDEKRKEKNRMQWKGKQGGRMRVREIETQHAPAYLKTGGLLVVGGW